MWELEGLIKICISVQNSSYTLYVIHSMLKKLLKRAIDNKLRNIIIITVVATITYQVIANVSYAPVEKNPNKDILISDNQLQATTSQPIPIMEKLKSFTKPSEKELQSTLTPTQFNVTQKEGTERPFENDLYDNKRTGIYVDVVSGEPLFSSKDKYDSGTGWPSFVQPITKDSLVLHEDTKLFVSRTEVRSKIADSHLGHVFNDGPADRGGLRYCMNSAGMRFIPVEDMEKEGYGEYLPLVQ